MKLSYKEDMAPLSNLEIKEALKDEKTIDFKVPVMEYEDLSDLIRIFLTRSWKEATYTIDGKVQCQPAKLRSITDLYLFLRTYKPRLTIKTLRETLSALWYDNKIRVRLCDQMKRSIIRYDGVQENVTAAKRKQFVDQYTEFGTTIKEFLNII